MEEVIDRFIETESVKFELRAINGDGEVLVKFDSSFSADDVTGYSYLVDEKILQLAIEYSKNEAEAKADMEAEAQMQEAME